MKTEIVSASVVNHGDTIIISGKEVTVDRKYINNGPHGITIHGQPFKKGVERVLFAKWFKSKITGWHPQI